MFVHKKIEAISKIPTLPEIAITIMKKTSTKSSSSISEISKLIQKDMSLTSNVLKLVNSPFYNVGKSIGNLQQALVMLGTNEIRNLVISISLYSIYQSKNISEGFKKIWQHSMNTALVSQYISQSINIKSERLFIGALIHDIGWLLIHQNYQDLATEYDARKSNDFEYNRALEVELFGMTHEQIGTYAATLWGLPENIFCLVENHHIEDVGIDDLTEISILQLANFYTDLHALQKSSPYESVIADYYPLIETFSEKYPEQDFLNTKGDFFQYVFTLLNSSSDTNLSYH